MEGWKGGLELEGRIGREGEREGLTVTKLIHVHAYVSIHSTICM